MITRCSGLKIADSRSSSVPMWVLLWKCIVLLLFLVLLEMLLLLLLFLLLLLLLLILQIPNGNAFSLFSSLSHGSPEAVRKSTGSLPGKSFSLEESSVLNAPRKKLNSPSLASMNEDDKNNSYSSRRSSGGVRNDLAGRKVVFANDIQSSHHERVGPLSKLHLFVYFQLTDNWAHFCLIVDLL